MEQKKINPNNGLRALIDELYALIEQLRHAFSRSGASLANPLWTSGVTGGVPVIPVSPGAVAIDWGPYTGLKVGDFIRIDGAVNVTSTDAAPVTFIAQIEDDAFPGVSVLPNATRFVVEDTGPGFVGYIAFGGILQVGNGNSLGNNPHLVVRVNSSTGTGTVTDNVSTGTLSQVTGNGP